jgi:hypothetical protein
MVQELHGVHPSERKSSAIVTLGSLAKSRARIASLARAILSEVVILVQSLYLLPMSRSLVWSNGTLCQVCTTMVVLMKRGVHGCT